MVGWTTRGQSPLSRTAETPGCPALPEPTLVGCRFAEFARSTLDEVLEAGVLRAGTPGDFNPMTFMNPDSGEYEGYYIDVAKDFAADISITSNIEAGSLIETYPGLTIVPIDAPRNNNANGMIVPRGDQVFLNYVNTWITMKEYGGYFRALSGKWQLVSFQTGRARRRARHSDYGRLSSRMIALPDGPSRPIGGSIRLFSIIDHHSGRTQRVVKRSRLDAPRSTRTMARAVGICPDSAHRTWQANNLEPHLTRTFKVSTDKHFEEKLWDVIGLYLNPPERALVLQSRQKKIVPGSGKTRSLPGQSFRPRSSRLTAVCTNRVRRRKRRRQEPAPSGPRNS